MYVEKDIVNLSGSFECRGSKTRRTIFSCSQKVDLHDECFEAAMEETILFLLVKSLFCSVSHTLRISFTFFLLKVDQVSGKPAS